MKILFRCFLVCSVLITSSCRSKWHVLEFQNVSSEIVNYSTEGIQLYSKGGGPQNLGGWCHPGVSGSYSVMGPLRLSYPVKVSWESKDSDKKGTQEFSKIPGIPEGQKVVKDGGGLVVGLTADFKVMVFFVRGDAIDSHLCEQILKGEVPLPE